mmetsp:Transcript_35589/g.82642  ORF Transcript_35589/g.82642 Transcript_35589/m.82642 type:complete len:206 (-) Transcript_35589:110-727(-)
MQALSRKIALQCGGFGCAVSFCWGWVFGQRCWASALHAPLLLSSTLTKEVARALLSSSVTTRVLDPLALLACRQRWRASGRARSLGWTWPRSSISSRTCWRPVVRRRQPLAFEPGYGSVLPSLAKTGPAQPARQGRSRSMRLHPECAQHGFLAKCLRCCGGRARVSEGAASTREGNRAPLALLAWAPGTGAAARLSQRWCLFREA